jgi:uncharacterized membrane protein
MALEMQPSLNAGAGSNYSNIIEHDSIIIGSLKRFLVGAAAIAVAIALTSAVATIASAISAPVAEAEAVLASLRSIQRALRHSFEQR